MIGLFQSALLSFLLYTSSSNSTFIGQPCKNSNRIVSDQCKVSTTKLLQSTNENDNLGEAKPIKSVVSASDSGSDDVSDRFKYKVNALMGMFDPLSGSDDEYETGNIMSALMKFPTSYTFEVVGRTCADEETVARYVETVRAAVLKISGDLDDAVFKVTPRGKNFTRVTVEVMVYSSPMINSIYDCLGDLELTVFNY